jgi:hypothetical protein
MDNPKDKEAMKLYRIVTEYQKYKWVVRTPFLCLYAWGATMYFVNPPKAKLPTLLFFFLLLLWAVIWLIGWFSWKNYLTKGK